MLYNLCDMFVLENVLKTKKKLNTENKDMK